MHWLCFKLHQNTEESFGNLQSQAKQRLQYCVCRPAEDKPAHGHHRCIGEGGGVIVLLRVSWDGAGGGGGGGSTNRPGILCRRRGRYEGLTCQRRGGRRVRRGYIVRLGLGRTRAGPVRMPLLQLLLGLGKAVAVSRCHVAAAHLLWCEGWGNRLVVGAGALPEACCAPTCSPRALPRCLGRAAAGAARPAPRLCVSGATSFAAAAAWLRPWLQRWQQPWQAPQACVALPAVPLPVVEPWPWRASLPLPLAACLHMRKPCFAGRRLDCA